LHGRGLHDIDGKPAEGQRGSTKTWCGSNREIISAADHGPSHTQLVIRLGSP
jgi:hypothetical protein